MLVTLKNLQQQTFQIEISADDTVKALKEKIESSKGAGDYAASAQKLIYAGKILGRFVVFSTDSFQTLCFQWMTILCRIIL